jgi:hypothetical protein
MNKSDFAQSRGGALIFRASDFLVGPGRLSRCLCVIVIGIEPFLSNERDPATKQLCSDVNNRARRFALWQYAGGGCPGELAHTAPPAEISGSPSAF